MMIIRDAEDVYYAGDGDGVSRSLKNQILSQVQVKLSL